jgi:hypothetical protein
MWSGTRTHGSDLRAAVFLGRRPARAVAELLRDLPYELLRPGRRLGRLHRPGSQEAQDDLPGVFPEFVARCSGNVTAGKCRDGSPENRPIPAGRIHRAMAEAWAATERSPIERAAFHSVPLRLEPRKSPGFAIDDLKKRLDTNPRPFGQCLAAMGLAWRSRADAGHTIDVPVLDLGKVRLLLLPGESYVEYQHLAQRARPDSFVVTMGYGEAGTGYVPTDRHFEERDPNLNDWCWVAPGSESRMARAIEAALRGPR